MIREGVTLPGSADVLPLATMEGIERRPGRCRPPSFPNAAGLLVVTLQTTQLATPAGPPPPTMSDCSTGFANKNTIPPLKQISQRSIGYLFGTSPRLPKPARGSPNANAAISRPLVCCVWVDYICAHEARSIRPARDGASQGGCASRFCSTRARHERNAVCRRHHGHATLHHHGKIERHNYEDEPSEQYLSAKNRFGTASG